jgi:hypothetical protein
VEEILLIFTIKNYMSCKFTIHYPQHKEELVAKLQDAILTTGGQFEGDTSEGRFHGNTPIGSFEGNYVITGDDIEVDVIKKPFLISCSRIESEIKKYLGQELA